MTIVTAWPGASAQEMQDQVAEPLEKRMQELRWYDRTETYTRPGLAFTTLTLLDSTPPAEVKEEFYQARKKVGDEAANLPPGVIGPMVNDEYADVTFALYALKAKGEPQRLLVRDAETLRQRLLHVPGVKKVNIIGEQPERISSSSRTIAWPRWASAAGCVCGAEQPERADPGRLDRNQGRRSSSASTAPSTAAEDPRHADCGAGTHAETVRRRHRQRGYEDPATFMIRNGGEPALLLGVVMRDGWNGLDLGKALEAKSAPSMRNCRWA
jgi:multidrug efflux pump subunit AcrB